MYDKYSVGDIIAAFVEGARFDASAIALLNAPYFLILIWPLKNNIEKSFARFWLKLLFVLSNSLFLSLNIFDAEYYKFIGRRLTAGSFAISKDINDQFFQIFLSYWYFSLLMILTLPVLWWLYDLFSKKKRTPSSFWIFRLGRFVFLLALLALVIRGGSQSYPLTVAHAFIGNKPELAQLRLNSTLTIIKSTKTEGLPAINYFESDEIAAQILKRNSQLAEPVFDTPPNIVFIILESFHLEYMGLDKTTSVSHTPFLDSLAEKSAYFKYNFANGRRSIDALPSILAGIPALMREPLITSTYQSTTYTGLPSVLVNNGYQTAFFHGGHDGTMFFDVMANMLGFQQYFGSNGYPDKADRDGKWGIFDEPFLQYAAQTISTFQQPFMSTIFTLSSHHPYTIPDKYKDQFLEGPLKIHQAIEYADFSLKKFFETAEKMPWFANTLFVITADHTGEAETTKFQSAIGMFRVPLLFYYPKSSTPNSGDLKLHTEQISQHIDIMPTVLNLVGIEAKHAKFGHSLMTDAPSFALLYRDSNYLLIGPTYAIVQDPFKGLAIYDWQDDWDLDHKLDPEEVGDSFGEMEAQLKANIQLFNNGLIKNNLSR